VIGYTDDEAVHLACARRYIERKIGAMPAPFAAGAPWRNPRIRVAYLSPDFREHPVGRLTVELFERHDRAHFEVIGISLQGGDGSALRSRLAAAFDRFEDVATMSDGDVAALLAQARIDIAVDLAGYTQGHRPEIFAYRPAPIAVSYLGYSATTGAGFIDYIVGDRSVLPPARQAFFSERVVQLPDCFMVSDSRRAIADAEPTRRAAGLPEDGVVFCAFNNHAKIAEPMFDLWMRLLGAVPGSVLWLSDARGIVADNLRAAAAARGIDPVRLVFAPRLRDFSQHLARHRLADLFLDTLPYNAHTTANDALWAGLPVLTCRGNCLAGRVASSLVEAVGLGELATANLADYEALALRLAADASERAALKARLARNRLTHPLFDTPRFTRHLEAAYRVMWETWQRGEPPRSFAVEAARRDLP
jgi:protein O-GlcNAc transferase